MQNNNLKRVRPEELLVDETARPGWVSGGEQLPSIGDQVYCTDGMAEVIRHCGKTTEGHRILELKILDERTKPFYASATNVRVEPKKKKR